MLFANPFISPCSASFLVQPRILYMGYGSAHCGLGFLTSSTNEDSPSQMCPKGQYDLGNTSIENSFSCDPRLCQVDKANQNTYLTQRPVQMLKNISQFHLTKRRDICGSLHQQEMSVGAQLASFCIFFKFTLGCQPMGWYHPYERRVFSQLNLTGNSLADLGFTMALAVWYPISLTVKSTTTTTSRGLVTHTFRGFSSFDSAHPWSPRLALAQWIRTWNKGAWHFVSDLEKYCVAEKFLRCQAPGAVETDGRRTWIP